MGCQWNPLSLSRLGRTLAICEQFSICMNLTNLSHVTYVFLYLVMYYFIISKCIYSVYVSTGFRVSTAFPEKKSLSLRDFP